MSTIDERIVRMQFDNAKFQSGISTTLASLSRLNEGLQFNNASKGFINIQNGIKKISFSSITDQLDGVKASMSALEVVGFTVIQRLTNKAMDAFGTVWANTIGQIKSGGISRAMNLEQAQFQLEGLGVQWSEIKGIINDAVTGTSYGLDAAAKVASQLVASNVSIIGGSNSPMQKALNAVSGVAAMTSSSYEDIGRIFTTVAGQGRLMADQLNQIAARGLNAAAALAQYLHVSEAEVREMTSKGQISFDLFSEAMYSAYGEQAKKANETFTGALSNMKSALSRIGAEVASPGLTNLRDIFNTIRETINGIHEDLMPLINIINEFQNTFTKGFVELFKTDESGNSFGRDIFGGVLNILTAIGNILFPLKDGFANLFPDELVAKWKEKASNFRKVTKEFLDNTNKDISDVLGKDVSGNVIQAMQQAYDIWVWGTYGNGEDRVKALGDTYEETQEWVEKIVSGEITYYELEKMIAEKAAETSESMEGAADSVELSKDKISGWVSLRVALEAVKNIGEGIRNVFTFVKQVARAAIDAFKEVFSFGETATEIYDLSEKFKKFTESMIMSEKTIAKVQKAFKGLFAAADIVRQVVVKLFEFITGASAKEVQGAAKVTVNILSLIGDWIFKLDNALKNTESVGDFFILLWDNIRSGFTSALVYIQEHIPDIISSVWETLKSLWHTISDTLQNKIAPDILGIIGQVKDTIINIFSSVGEKFKNGDNGGIIDWLKDKLSKFLEFVSSIDFGSAFNKIKTDISNFFGWTSDEITEEAIPDPNEIIKKTPPKPLSAASLTSAIIGTNAISGLKSDGFTATIRDIFANGLIEASESASDDAVDEIEKSDKISGKKSIFVKLLNTLTSIFGSAASSVFSFSTEFLTNVWKNIKELLTSANDIFGKLIPKVFDFLNSLIDNIDMTAIGTSIADFLGAIAAVISKIASYAKESANDGTLSKALDGIGEFISTLVGLITDIAKNAGPALAPIGDKFLLIIHDILDIIHTVLTEIKNDPKGAMEHGLAFYLMTMIKDITTSMRAFGEAAKGFSNIGTAIKILLSGKIKPKMQQAKELVSSITSLMLVLIGAYVVIAASEKKFDIDASKVILGIFSMMAIIVTAIEILLKSVNNVKPGPKSLEPLSELLASVSKVITSFGIAIGIVAFTASKEDIPAIVSALIAINALVAIILGFTVALIKAVGNTKDDKNAAIRLNVILSEFQKMMKGLRQVMFWFAVSAKIISTINNPAGTLTSLIILITIILGAMATIMALSGKIKVKTKVLEMVRLGINAVTQMLWKLALSMAVLIAAGGIFDKDGTKFNKASDVILSVLRDVLIFLSVLFGAGMLGAKIIGNNASINSYFSGLEQMIGSIGVLLIGVAASIALLTASGVKPTQLLAAGASFSAIVLAVGVVVGLLFALSKIIADADQKLETDTTKKELEIFDAITKSIIKIAASMLLIGAAIAIIGKIKSKNIALASGVLAGFVIFIGVLVGISALIAKSGFGVGLSTVLESISGIFVKIGKAALMFSASVLVAALALKVLLKNWKLFKKAFGTESGAEEVAVVMTNMFSSLSTTFRNVIHKLIQDMIYTLRQILVVYLPEIVQVFVDMVETLTKILEEHPDFIPKIVNLAITIASQVIHELGSAIFSGIADIFDSAGKKGMASFFNRLVAEEDGTGAQKFRSGMDKLLSSIFTIAMITKVLKRISKVTKAVENISPIAKDAGETISKTGETTEAACSSSLAKFGNALKAFALAHPYITAILAGLTVVTFTLKWIFDTSEANIDVDPDTEEYKRALDELNEKYGEVKKGASEATEATQELITAFDEVKRAHEEKVSKVVENNNYYKDLKARLDEITDEKGNVTLGYQTEAQNIIDILNNQYGTEISLIDGVIDKYDEQMSALDDLIKKRENAEILTAMQEESSGSALEIRSRYDQIIKNERTISDLEAARKRIIEDRAKVQKEIDGWQGWTLTENILGLDSGTITEWNDINTYYDKIIAKRDELQQSLNGKNHRFSPEEAKLRQSNINMLNSIIDLQERYSAVTNEYNNFSQARLDNLKASNEQLAREAEQIQNMTTYYDEAAYYIDKDADKASLAMAKWISGFQTASSATASELSEQKKRYEDELAFYQKRYEETGRWESQITAEQYYMLINDTIRNQQELRNISYSGGKAQSDAYAKGLSEGKDGITKARKAAINPYNLSDSEYTKFEELMRTRGAAEAMAYARGILDQKSTVDVARKSLLFGTEGFNKVKEFIQRQVENVRELARKARESAEESAGFSWFADDAGKFANNINDIFSATSWTPETSDNFLAKTVDGFNDRLTSTAKSSATSMADSISSALGDISPTITPVIDLDEATSQISGLGALFNSNFGSISGSIAESINVTDYLQRMAGGNDELLDKINMLTDALNGSTIVPEGTTFQFDSILDGRVVSKTLAPNLDILAGQNMLLSGRGGSIPR